jgi:hypothetical protein
MPPPGVWRPVFIWLFGSVQVGLGRVHHRLAPSPTLSCDRPAGQRRRNKNWAAQFRNRRVDDFLPLSGTRDMVAPIAASTRSRMIQYGHRRHRLSVRAAVRVESRCCSGSAWQLPSRAELTASVPPRRWMPEPWQIREPCIREIFSPRMKTAKTLPSTDSTFAIIVARILGTAQENANVPIVEPVATPEKPSPS